MKSSLSMNLVACVPVLIYRTRMMASQVLSSDKTLNRDSNVDISLFETRLGKGERKKNCNFLIVGVVRAKV